MNIIAIEEHLATPAVLEAWVNAPEADAEGLDYNAQGLVGQQLLDLDERRLLDMDAVGVDVHVLSVTSPGVQNLEPADAVALAREANDLIAAATRRHPDRFQGLATLPTPDSSAAAEELRRSVRELGFKGAMLNGRTQDRNIDHVDNDELYAAAVELGVPIYIHPRTPVAGVRDAYYSGFGALDSLFSRPGLGWHYETGIQLVRLILSGTFDRHPELQVIVGHWGEVVLFYIERVSNMDRMGASLDRPIADYFRQNVHYTPSGMLSERYLRWCVDLVGIDRLMFSTDYPYIPLAPGAARRFVEEVALSDEDRELFAHGNWERLTGHLTGSV